MQSAAARSHALLGANGAGKSTLVKILAGVHAADSGEVYVDGRPMRFHAPVDAMAVGIATVFQDPALIPDLTVRQNLQLSEIDESAFTLWLAWFDLEALDTVALVRDLPLETLRMVDLARALARDPQVLLLDEITAALTARPGRAGLRPAHALEGARARGCADHPPAGRGKAHLRPRHHPA